MPPADIARAEAWEQPFPEAQCGTIAGACTESGEHAFLPLQIIMLGAFES